MSDDGYVDTGDMVELVKGRYYFRGRMGGVIHKPVRDKPLSNVCFGGPKFDMLYVTAGDKVFRRPTLTTGVRYGMVEK